MVFVLGACVAVLLGMVAVMIHCAVSHPDDRLF